MLGFSMSCRPERKTRCFCALSHKLTCSSPRDVMLAKRSIRQPKTASVGPGMLHMMILKIIRNMGKTQF